MHTRRFLTLLFLFVLVLTNGAAGGNIAYGVSVVVIDAGHGGKFSGAHYGGLYEKELTLKVALRLGELIEQEMPGVKVVYTRKTDKELHEDLASDLQARADIANKAGGDIFISIHVNAARSTSAQGVETLIMGESPKEQRYNESALFDNNHEDLIDMSDERTAAIVRAYIQNLQFTYGEYSMTMARCIQNNYQKANRTSRGIKPQLLRVLYATDMPGVLTEIGFMSNPQEAAYLKSAKGQEQIVRSLLESVKEYSDHVLSMRLAEEGPVQGAADQSTVVRDSMPATTPAPVKAVKTPVSDGKTTAQPAGKRVRYAVQVVASVKTIPTSSSQFKNYRGKVKQYASEGKFRYKYCVGECADFEAAQRKQKEVRKVFPGAFVVKCRDGKIVK